MGGVWHLPTQRILKKNPCWTDLSTSWWAKQSKPKWPSTFKQRILSFFCLKKKTIFWLARRYHLTMTILSQRNGNNYLRNDIISYDHSNNQISFDYHTSDKMQMK